MEIDKASADTNETIVLFPRSYNKRGDERLHSVQGVTLDGREVNIKLRVDEAMQGKENTPSIAEFSREDVKAKNPCLASPENAPGQREGVLLFTGCEEDGENKKGILSFTARWGYVLASHSDAPDPVFGLGRVVMIADSHAAKTIHAEITELERTKIEGWEAISERKRKALSDPMLFSYYGQLYMQDEESSFSTDDREALIDFSRGAFLKYTKNGIVGGLLIRLQSEDGKIISGFSSEIFPRWKRNNSYQTADDVLGYFFQANAKHLSADSCSKILVMPIKRYSCGPSFKNYYFLKKPEDSLLKLRKRFLINNEPTVSNIAFALSRREESGECFMLKYYPLSNPLSSVADIGKPPEISEGPSRNNDLGADLDPSFRAMAGLSGNSAIAFPAWHKVNTLEPSQWAQKDAPEEVMEQSQQIETQTDLPPEASEEILVVVSDAFETHGVEPIERLGPVEADDGDLSDLFSDISEEELERIAEVERAELEESARAERIATEAAEAAEAELERQAVPGTPQEEPIVLTDTQTAAETAAPLMTPSDEVSVATPTTVAPIRFIDSSTDESFVTQEATEVIKVKVDDPAEPILEETPSELQPASNQPSALQLMLMKRGLL